jgi:hypothetical protein
MDYNTSARVHHTVESGPGLRDVPPSEETLQPTLADTPRYDEET